MSRSGFDPRDQEADWTTMRGFPRSSAPHINYFNGFSAQLLRVINTNATAVRCAAGSSFGLITFHWALIVEWVIGAAGVGGRGRRFLRESGADGDSSRPSHRFTTANQWLRALGG